MKTKITIGLLVGVIIGIGIWSYRNLALLTKDEKRAIGQSFVQFASAHNNVVKCLKEEKDFKEVKACLDKPTPTQTPSTQKGN